MLIILEGVDGAGKTTLAGRLGALMSGSMRPLRVLHRGPVVNDPLVEYELDLEAYEPGGDENVLCDRWHIGELVYGPLLRGESKLDHARWAHVDKFLQAKGALIVHVIVPAEVAIDRLKDRGDDLVTPDHVQPIIDGYHDALWRSTVTAVHLDGRDVGDEVLGEVLKHALHTETIAADLVRYGSYVGPRLPSYLLVGERRNDGPQGDPRFTSAFAPLPGTSGSYLLNALSESTRHGAGLANAQECDIGELWESLGHPRVCALGRTAKTILEEMEVPHGAVPHPQYVRRFHHAHAAAYGALIRSALDFQEDRLSWRP